MSSQELKVQQKQEVKQNGETTKPDKYFIPAVDIYESAEQLTVLAEMPGVADKGVDISLENNILTIQGTKEADTLEHAGILLQEYEAGHYLRRFTVAEAIDQDKINASMTNGLLKIILPKASPARPRKIEVNTE